MGEWRSCEWVSGGVEELRVEEFVSGGVGEFVSGGVGEWRSYDKQ